MRMPTGIAAILEAIRTRLDERRFAATNNRAATIIVLRGQVQITTGPIDPNGKTKNIMQNQSGFKSTTPSNIQKRIVFERTFEVWHGGEMTSRAKRTSDVVRRC